VRMAARLGQQAVRKPGLRLRQKHATFGSVFAAREFRALWIAQVQSVAGDQLARVALTLHVFDRTHSSFLAAVTFAASVVPAFLGGLLFSGLADRLPRRRVMIACDLIRAGLVAIMVIPNVAVEAQVCLLFIVTMTSAAFSSARAALYPDILTGESYVVGMAITLTTFQFAQVVGFATGGLLVAIFGVSTSLLADAITYLLSAVITLLFITARPAAQSRADSSADKESLFSGLRLVFSTSGLRTPMLFGWLAAFYNAPEGVAAPLAAAFGGGAGITGDVLAAEALGASVGALLFSRGVDPASRQRLVPLLAAMACAALTLFGFRPPLLAALGILFMSGLLDCFQIAASTAFVMATPTAQRSQAFGIAQGGMSMGQGVAMLLAGAAAQHHSPSLVIASVGGVGFASALLIAASRNEPFSRQHAP
jgi:predicted MFS family arabinose efflux permease